MNFSDFIGLFYNPHFFAFFCILIAEIFGIIYLKNKRNIDISNAPSILITTGILGTFFGIALGLFKFNTSNIQSSIPFLIDGIKTSAWASVFGILFALFFKFYELLSEKKEVQKESTVAEVDPTLNLLNNILRQNQRTNNYLESFIKKFDQNQDFLSNMNDSVKTNLNESKIFYDKNYEFYKKTLSVQDGIFHRLVNIENLLTHQKEEPQNNQNSSDLSTLNTIKKLANDIKVAIDTNTIHSIEFHENLLSEVKKLQQLSNSQHNQTEEQDKLDFYLMNKHLECLEAIHAELKTIDNSMNHQSHNLFKRLTDSPDSLLASLRDISKSVEKIDDESVNSLLKFLRNIDYELEKVNQNLNDESIQTHLIEIKDTLKIATIRPTRKSKSSTLTNEKGDSDA